MVKHLLPIQWVPGSNPPKVTYLVKDFGIKIDFTILIRSLSGKNGQKKPISFNMYLKLKVV